MAFLICESLVRLDARVVALQRRGRQLIKSDASDRIEFCGAQLRMQVEFSWPSRKGMKDLACIMTAPDVVHQ